MQKQTEQTTITVPVPNHAQLRIGTLQSIIRQSQLPLHVIHGLSADVQRALFRARPRRREAAG
jgi:hypothetical protein